ncbi:MAG: M6 family metalloprotease domain-containing protein [candidate division Zixibacteria bacterium]|nr:M6 family metalloprotease domain-containing protein [candidate division Zixibacteria bacterium]
MTRTTTYSHLLVVACTILIVTATAFAHSPTEEARKKFEAEGTWEQKVANLRARDSVTAVIEASRSHIPPGKALRDKLLASPDAVDTTRICVIMVDFQDYRFDQQTYYVGGVLRINSSVHGTPADFQTKLFTRQGVDPVYNPTGSMTEFYWETSYGKYLVLGDVHGPYTMSQNYSYYVGLTDGANAAELATNAVDSAEANGVDFSPYGDQYNIVPSVVIIHAGPGAETGAYGIWSHKSAMVGGREYDGVSLSAYTMQPEEQGSGLSTVGVFCHEWGHTLGLADYYDLNSSSPGEGLGRFSVMAGGSWNNGGSTPCHFDPWCKWSLGFVTPIKLTDNIGQAPIPQIESEPVAYWLTSEVGQMFPAEAWLVENRQRVGFDQYLPGDGLCIYHIDYSAGAQVNPDRYRVSLEQADGLYQMNFGGSQGDAGDTWPGSTNNRDFFGYSSPPAVTNVDSVVTQAGVWHISDSDSLMTADLDVRYNHPYCMWAGDTMIVSDAAGGDGDGIPEPGETIEIDINILNVMGNGYNAYLRLFTDNPEITVVSKYLRVEDLHLNNLFGVQSMATPFVLELSDDYRSSYVNFTLRIRSDTALGTGDLTNDQYLEYSMPLGKKQILVVDDDGGFTYETWLTAAFDRMAALYDVWNMDINPSPTTAELLDYEYVFWMNGGDIETFDGEPMTAGDIAAVTGFLEGGGSLVLGSATLPRTLAALDSTFVADYLHATVSDSVRTWYSRGATNSFLGDENIYRINSNAPLYGWFNTLMPANGGHVIHQLVDQANTVVYGDCGIAYDGAYKTLFFSIPLELIGDQYEANGFMPKDSLLDRVLSFLERGGVTPVDEGGTDNLIPGSFALDQNYPNPFNPSTVISYSIAKGMEQTRLAVFNVLGQEVATLVDQVQGPGTYTVTWDGRTDGGSEAASGVYLYRLSRGDQLLSRKMIMLK